jgi:hypothetical protein
MQQSNIYARFASTEDLFLNRAGVKNYALKSRFSSGKSLLESRFRGQKGRALVPASGQSALV